MMPSEIAHDTVAALGETGLLQFKDLNYEKSGFQRAYANQVRKSIAAGVSKALIWYPNHSSLG